MNIDPHLDKEIITLCTTLIQQQRHMSAAIANAHPTTDPRASRHLREIIWHLANIGDEIRSILDPTYGHRHDPR